LAGTLPSPARAGLLRRSLAVASLVATSLAVLAVVSTGAARPRRQREDAASSSCSSGETVPRGTPSSAEASGSDLHQPGDLTLNGYNFSLRVLGYGLGSCLASSELGGAGYAAVRGDVVAMVSFDLRYYGSFGSYYAPDLSFVVDGRRVPAIGAGAEAGNGALVLSVPRDASVAFAASEAGLTQEFSLRTGERLPPAPEALYRDPNSPVVTEKVGRSHSLRLVDHLDHLDQRDRIELSSASLSWFEPIDPRVHAGASGAYLQVNLDEQAPASDGLGFWVRALPPGDLRLVLPDGRRLAPDPASTVARQPSDLVDGTYFFDVPAGFTTGKLEVTPGIELAVSPDTLRNVRVELLGTASFPIHLPPPEKVVTGSLGGPGASTSRASGSGTRRSPAGSGPLPTPAVVLLVLALEAALAAPVLGGLRVLRRRRLRRLGPYSADASGRVEPFPVPGLLPLRRGGLGAKDEEAAGPAPEDLPLGALAPPPAIAPEGWLTFRVLGPLGVDGLELPPERPVVIELLCFLACHKQRRFSASEVIAELWPLGEDGRETVSQTTFRSYVSLARRAAGTGRFPKASGGTYGLGEEVETDWHRFVAIVESAKEKTGPEARACYAAALGLVAGPAFSGVPEGRYAWNAPLVSEIEVAVVAAASSLVEACIEADVPAEALSPLRRALLATRDHGIGDDLLTAAGATGNLAALERAWRDVGAALGDDAETLRRSYEAIRSRLVAEPVG
jgi:hypothetical protein